MDAAIANAKMALTLTAKRMASLTDAADGLDPLALDNPADDRIITTRRAICRVALVAAETAGRFEREKLRRDPMSWMLARRALFDGEVALDACLHRTACLRAIFIHGLGLDPDIDPAELVALIGEI